MIPRFLRRSVALGLVAAALGSGCASTLRDAATIRYDDDKGEERVVHLRRDQFEDELREIAATGDVPESPAGTITSDITASWLGNFVFYTAVDAELAKRGLEVTAAQRDQARQSVGDLNVSKEFTDSIIEREARRLAVFESVTAEAEIAEPTEADARAYYDANVDAITACPSARNVKQALFGTEAEAQAAIDQLNAGASFAEVAAQGGGTSSDCLDNNQYGGEFTAVATAAPIGQITGPVASDAGFHAIRVTDWNPTYEQFADRILQFLQQQAEQARQSAFEASFGEILNGWYERFSVTTDPRYGTWDDSQRQIVAPESPQPRNQREARLDGPTTTTTPLGVEGG